MAKETTREKGQRLADEGRVEKVGTNEYLVHGDSGKVPYRVAKGTMFFNCPCPARKKDCSHVEAVHAHRQTEMGIRSPKKPEPVEVPLEPGGGSPRRTVEVEVSIEEISRVGERAAAASGYYDGGLDVRLVNDPERIMLQSFEDEEYVASVIGGVLAGKLQVTREVELAEGENALALTATEQVALF